MTKLNCGVINCVYNEKEKCCRDEIYVKGEKANSSSETCCGDFVNGKETSKQCNACGTESTRVGCEAVHCHYNESGKCSANHIAISGRYADRTQETECASFCI